MKVAPSPTDPNHLPASRVVAGARWAVWLAALLLTGATGFALVWIESEWVRTRPFFFDPASYQILNIHLAGGVRDYGRWPVVWYELTHNAVNPLRTIPLVLCAPELLAHPLGHLGTSLPMLAIFLGLLGTLSLRRSGSLLMALAAMLGAVAVPHLYDPLRGLGAYWLDLPAGYLIGAGALALLLSEEGRKRWWLAAFAVLIAAAHLSRYVAGAYAFCACAPLLAWFSWKRLRAGEGWRAAVWQPLGLVGLIVMLTAGWFLLGEMKVNMSGYGDFGYGTRPMLGSLKFTLVSIGSFLEGQKYLGLLVFAALLLPMICGAGANENSGGPPWERLLLQWWLPISVVAFLTLTCLVGEAAHATLYAIPLLTIAAFVPTAPFRPKFSRLGFVFALGLAAAASMIASTAAKQAYQMAARPTPTEREEKASDAALADAISREGDHLMWVTYYDEQTQLLNLECFYRAGRLMQPATGDVRFNVHESYWRAIFPGMSPEEVSHRLLANARQKVDLAVVCADPALVEAVSDNPFSAQAARYFSEQLADSPEWQRVFALPVPRFGTVIGYRNSLRHPQLPASP